MKYLNLTTLLIVLAITSRAQQPLNLDFERLSMEGIARPWGWDLENAPSITISLDSNTTHHGKYSLHIQSDTLTEALETQILRFDLEPYLLRKHQITVKGWIKTEGLDGAAFVTLGYALQNENRILANSSKMIMGTNHWQTISIQLEVPEAAPVLSLQVHHSGSGISWFDDFSLVVEGQELQELEIAPPITNKQVKWLQKTSYPIRSVDAGDAFQDLLPFKQMVGDAQIIALGESTHGTSEFFRLKHRILEYAVEELGVRIFALEDNQVVVERVNKYVMGGAGTARSSMFGLFSVWQTEEVHDLIQWMRNYNDQHPKDRAAFVGFDLQNLALPMDSLFAFAARRSQALLARITPLLDDLKNNGARSYLATDSVKMGWWHQATEVLELVKKQEQQWLAEAQDQTDSLQVFWGIQYANLVKQYAENAYKGHQSLYRDLAMAENISWTLDRHPPGTRMLIWAHDVHISLGEHPNADLNYYYGHSMGAQLRKKYGVAYKAFGLWTYSGEYWAQVSYGDFRQLACPLLPGPRGSLDEALHRVVLKYEAPTLLLDLRKARKRAWFLRPIPVRFANHVSVEYSYWTRYSIPYQFDGLFFVDQTTAAKSYTK